jgi:hypothetical protein
MSHRRAPRFPLYLAAAAALCAVAPVAPSLAADDPKPAAAPATSTADGKALLDATIKAHGGDAFLKMKGLKVVGKGTFSLPESQGGFKVPIDTVTLVAVAPDKSLLDADSAMGRLRFASMGGKKGGWISYGDDNPRDLTAEQSPSADPTALLRAVAARKLPVRAAADLDPKLAKSDDGKALSAFDVTGDRGIVTRVYVESDTHLVRRMTSKTKSGEATTVLGGYKEVSGITLPTSMVTFQNGNEVLSLTFATLEVNPTVADDTFAKPKPAPKPADPALGAGGGTSLP